MIDPRFRWPLSDLPQAIASALHHLAKHDLATLTTTAKLLEFLPSSSPGAIQLTKNLVHQVRCHPFSMSSTFSTMSNDGWLQYDALMFQLIQSGILHKHLSYNWIRHR